MEQEKEYQDMTFEEKVAYTEKIIFDEVEDLPKIYGEWCELVSQLVFPPQVDSNVCCDDAKIDLVEIMAMDNLFCRLSGMKKESPLSKLFFVFYRAWHYGYDDCRHDEWEADARRAAE